MKTDKSVEWAKLCILDLPRASSAYGSRDFYICGPRLWITLPYPFKNATTLETFRKHIQTHRFLNFYN